MKNITASLRGHCGIQARPSKRSAIALAVAAVIGQSAVVSAQESAPVLEEVVVKGLKTSYQQTLDVKRDSGAVVDSVTSEDIGQFPDQNVADSLSRITGVSVTRGFGEGEKIAVRGTSPNQNRTLLNGAAVASADWFVLDNPSRAFNYTLLPSNVVSRLDVYKTPQADMQEGSLGGSVVLHTRRPLDMEANSGSIQLNAMYSENSEEVDPMFSGLYSWKNDSETLGFNISLTRQDRTLLRDGQEVLGFQRQDFGAGEVWTPRAIGDAYFTQSRERETALVTGQWRPSDAGELTVTYLTSDLNADNVNHNRYEWYNGQAGGGVIDPATANIVGSGVVAGEVAGNYAEYYVIDRISFSETDSLDLQYSHDFDSFKMDVRLGMTEAEGGTSRDRQFGFDRFLDRSVFNGLQHTPYFNGAVEDEAALVTRGLGWMMENERIMSDEETYANLDFTFPVEMGVFNSVKVGAMFRDHDKDQYMNGTRFHWLTDAMHSDDATSYGGGSDTSGWDRWLYGNLNAGTLANYTYNEGGAPYPLLNTSKAAAAIFPDAAYANAATISFLPDTWGVNEQITAIFARADFEGDGFRGDIGVRVVQTDVESTGYNWEGDWLAASLDLLGGYELLEDLVDPRDDYNVRLETVDHDYTEVLPNVNVVFDMSEDSLLRFSAARVMARPDYITIANQESANLDTRTGARGNPELDPEIANQFDITYEWYFDEGAVLALAYFTKDIDGSPVSRISQELRFDPRTGADVEVDFLQPVNGGGSVVSGLEVGYQQNFGDFGIVANYTYTDADSNDERDAVAQPGSGLVRGTSEHMANLTGFYETSVISARLSYNYRSAWYDGIDGFGAESYVDDYGQLDASVRINVTDRLEVVLQGINITGEELEYYHIDEGRPQNLYDNGARYVVGVDYLF